MAKESWNNPINKHTDWGGDSTTNYQPVSGGMVQKFIKDSLENKAGDFFYDATNNRYLVFSDIDARNEYLADTTKQHLILGTFNAPFNYNAEIVLTSNAYNAIFLGAKGNYLDFTFDIKNKQGASTGENVVVTYTFMRNSIKKEVKENRRYGESVHFNIDEYLEEGLNTITIGIVGQTTLAATTMVVTYQVVNLTLNDDLDISKVYNLSNEAQVLEIPFSISGSGTKIIEWYLDGEKLDFIKSEDEIVDVSTSRVKYITLSNLQQGKHSLQFRAYSVINGENFYTNTLYRDIIVYTNNGKDLIIGVAVTIPKEYGILSNQDNVSIYNIVQYSPYTLRFATFSPDNIADTNVAIYIDDELKGNIISSNNVENHFNITSNRSGTHNLLIQANDVSYAIPLIISPTTMEIEEITNGLALDFNALGKNNSSPNKDEWTDGNFIGTLSGFNWNSVSGWVNGRLEMNAGSTFSIDYAPLAGEPTETGKTIEIEWSTKNVINDDAIICDLRNDKGVGIVITATKVSLISFGGVVIETEYKSNENVRVAFVINRASGVTNQKMSFIYSNGIVSRGEQWAFDESYSSNTTIQFNATNEAEISLKSIRVYDNALSSDQILNNYILYRDNVEEMTAIYDRNNVYEQGTSLFSPDKMMSRLPVMIVTGDIPTLENTSDKNTQIIVDIEYHNLQDTSKSFKMVGAAMRPQGTSSMGYPKKNFRIYTQEVADTILYDSNGNVVKDKLYAFKNGSQPVNCWCLKADYAESSGTHNTGIARLWNDALKNVQIDGEYVCRTNAQKIALESGYEYDVRTTIDGFPILLFYRPTTNADVIFIGKYNFNNDKSTESVFGFTGIPNFDNSKMQCWEVLNNGNALALFTSIDNFDKGWKEAFESRYPDTKTPNTSDLKAFCQWMVNVTQEDFATQKWEHLNIYMMAAYWCYLMRHAGADQFVKNAMFTSEDGQHFYYILYDNDTINGLINTGHLRIKPTDNRETKDESGAYVFAGHDSRLWNMLEADSEFNDIVKQIDNALYSAGISYNNAIKVFDEQQANKWVERVYNQDAQYKYITPFIEKGIDNLFMLQGKRDLHRKWWLAKRYSIYDAKYVSGAYKSQAIEIKCINGTEVGQQFTIKSGYPLEYGYGINNVPRESNIQLGIGDTYTFTTKEVVNLGDPIRIYGASNIAELDLSQMASKLAVLTISNVYDETLGSKLTKLVVGKDGVTNNELSDISGLKQATSLEYLDIQGMTNIKSLDLSNQIYLNTLKAKGSSVTSISFAKGALITTLQLPSTMGMLSLEQLPLLTSSGISFANITNIIGMRVLSCPNVSNDFNFVYNWYSTKTTPNENSSLIMDNINWKGVDVDKLIELTNIRTLDLKGKVVLNEITLEQLTRLREVFGETAFDQDADFAIDAPNAIFILGKTEILEGSTEQYSCIAFGSKIKSIIWKITSGGNATYTSIDQDSGLLTVLEGAGNRTLNINAIVSTDSEISTQSISVVVSARVYPTSSTTTIVGATRLEEEQTTYTLAYSVPFNGTIEVVWSLNGMDGYAEILSSNNESCVIKKVGETASLVQGSLSCALKKKYNNSTLFTVTKSIEVVNDSIAETDAGICQALYDAGLCANNTYITKEEAAIIVASDIQKGTSYSTCIFYNKRNNIKSFNGLKWFISLVELPDYTFYGCQYLESIIIPNTITKIGRHAFYSCALRLIEIPDSVTSIGYDTFSDCKALTTITIPDSVTSIGNRCFDGCKALNYIKLSNSISELSTGIFTECESLTSIIIPNNVTRLRDDCFISCSSLKDINIPNNVTEIGNSCFSGCTSLETLHIPDTITRVGTSLFSNCTSLKYVYIPSSVNYVDSIFAGTRISGELVIDINENHPQYSFIDGGLYNKNITTFYWYAQDKINPNFTMPNSVTTIDNGAFKYCVFLETLQLSENITTIPGVMCEYCTSLKTINIPDGITDIGTNAFYNCKSLTSITIPDSLTYYLRESLFNGCSSLEFVKLPTRVEYMGGRMFYGCSSLKSVILPEGIKFLPDNTFHNCTSLETVQLPSTITEIKEYSFYMCSALKNIDIPEGVTKLGGRTFNGCRELQSITLPSTIQTLGAYQEFDGCISLSSITCKAEVAPNASSDTFGYSSYSYTGRNTYNTGENMLYVPQGATGYDVGVWLDPLQNSEKCGFTLSATL